MTSDNRATEAPVIYATDANGSTVMLETKRRKLYPARFATMFESTFSLLAGLDRPACYHRTLMQCLVTMDPTQWRKISASEIARETGMSHMSAKRGLGLLQSDRVIFGKGRGAARAYRLNNRLVSMTTSEKWHNLDPDLEAIDSRGR